MRLVVASIGLILALTITGCSTRAVAVSDRPPMTNPVVKEEKLVPVKPTKSTFSYNTVAPTVEKTTSTYVSSNGLARIDKKASYYEVYLDLEKGSHYDVGYGYGEVIKKAYPQYAQVMEPYIYENIYGAFPDLTDDFTPVSLRVEEMKKSIRKEYLQEIEGLADSLVGDTAGFTMNGKLSKEEINLIQFIPDVLRGTQCFGAAVYGDKSATGQTIAVRILEWQMGNENQMATAHCVVHFQEGEKSLTTYGVLGLLEAISVSNECGVFAGVLDSETKEAYTIKDKTSYPFELRSGMEQFKTAKEVGTYMVKRGKSFAYSHNILVTDPDKAYVVENAVGKRGICALREADSKLTKGIKWDHKEGIAVANGFALVGNEDNMTDSTHNMIRWKKINERLKAYDKVSVADLKDMLTLDDPNGYGSNLYSNYTYQMIIVDGKSGNIDIAFAPPCRTFPLKPNFVRVTHD